MAQLTLEVVQRFIDSLLDEHRLAGWKLEGLRFEVFTSSYNLIISRDENMVKIKIPSELVADAQNDLDPFKKRKIKSLLKDAIAAYPQK